MDLGSDRYTHIVSLGPDDEASVVRSRPGRGGAHAARRIDVSCGAQVMVDLYALRPQKHGSLVREHLGHYVMMRGIPLVWPVPAEALGDDVLIVIANRDTLAADVHVMDHWRP